MLRNSKLTKKILHSVFFSNNKNLNLQYQSIYPFGRSAKREGGNSQRMANPLEYLEQMDKKYEMQKKKQYERKGITEEPESERMGRKMIELYYEKPELFEKEVIYDPKTGLMGLKEDLEGETVTKDIDEAMEYYKDDIENDIAREKKNEARRKRRQERRGGIVTASDKDELLESMPENTSTQKDIPKQDNTQDPKSKTPKKKKGYLRDLTYEINQQKAQQEQSEIPEELEKKNYSSERREPRESREHREPKEPRETKEQRKVNIESEPGQRHAERKPRQGARAVSEEANGEEFDNILERFSQFESPVDEIAEGGERSSRDKPSRRTDSERTSDRKEGRANKLYEEVREDDLKKIERKLERENREKEQSLEIRHSEKREPAIKDYNKFVDKLSKKKTPSKFYTFLRDVQPENLVKLMSQSQIIESNPTQNIPKFLVLMSYMRKERVLQNYNREDIYQTFQAIINHLDQLTPIEISSVAVNLDKMKIDKVELFKTLETKILEDPAKYDLRSISNIVFSFARVSLKQSIIDDFSELYRKFETIIALKINQKTPQDLCQIMSGYSKSQNFSPEFLYVTEQASIDLFDNMNTQEIAIITHCFAKNQYESNIFFDKTRTLLLKQPEKFKIMEISLIAETFDQFNRLDKDLMKLIEKQFITKSENVNAQDIAILCKVLFREDYQPSEQTLDKIISACDFLYHNIDGTCLRKMFENFAERYKQRKFNDAYVNLLLRKFRNLEKNEMLRGSNLSYIRSEINKVKNIDDFRKKLMKQNK